MCCQMHQKAVKTTIHISHVAREFNTSLVAQLFVLAGHDQVLQRHVWKTACIHKWFYCFLLLRIANIDNTFK